MERAAAVVRRITSVVAIVMAAYHLYVVATGTPEAIILRGTHLLFSLALIFLTFPARAREQGRWWGWAADLGLLVLSIASIGYLFVNYEYVVNRIYYVDPLRLGDKVFGAILVLVVLEAARRTTGLVLPVTAAVFLLYALTGPYLPGILKHPGFSVEILLDQLYLTTEGIFGIPLGVSATYVIVFVVFGAFLDKSGVGQFFTDFATAITGGSRGGPGKVSVVSSSLFGTISGSAVANVMVDGWLTIPLMKRAGFRPPFAAAVEATASTGGQIMPPVMGAAAFVMAEFLGIPYIQVAKHALIPALLYYVALFFSIHFEALRSDLKGVPREEVPRLRDVILSRGHLFLPVILILALMVAGFTATYAALWATASVLVLSWLRRDTRMGVRSILEALESGARNTLAVAATCAAAGIIIGVIALTGLGLRFTSLVLGIAGQHLLPALVLTMVAGLILGMGMPTTPAYIVQAALLIPALVKMGVHPVAAHLFVIYFAAISAITPPVALAVYAAAGIGKARFWDAGIEAVKVGAAGFIVPYMFVFGPALLFLGSPGQIAWALVTATTGSVALAAALRGYLFRPATWLERVLLGAAAFLLIDQGLVTDAVGFGLLLGAVLLQRLTGRRPAAVPAPAGGRPAQGA
ncbi:TRAP transporter permease [Caldinitratiruptor microaerophilus]|uniref:TRAP transporter permease n=1 Tax=Caldinitratiruptor microaerophilus TaxID=671077 RepID=UPI00222F444C|nr:TRAP transporter permease [Caldinitratiruptor microaerophilus]